MSTVYLLRHGALAGDCRERYVGQLDPPLAPAGRRQAQELGAVLRALEIDTVYCSDLLRSRQSAALIVGDSGLTVEARSDLREIALGDWEGLARQDVAQRFPAHYAARGQDLGRYRVPGGESFADCLARVLAAWNDIVSRRGRRIVVVGHAGANRALLCHLLGRPLADLFGIGQDYGCVNVIDCRRAPGEVRAINQPAADLRACDPLLNLGQERTAS